MAAARKSTMTAEHKRALAQGRAEGRAVRAYLEALDQNRPRRGRPRTPASIEKRLKAVEALHPVHHAQLLTYIRLANIPLGLLLNFNVPVLKDGIKRMIL